MEITIQSNMATCVMVSSQCSDICGLQVLCRGVEVMVVEERFQGSGFRMIYLLHQDAYSLHAPLEKTFYRWKELPLKHDEPPLHAARQQHSFG